MNCRRDGRAIRRLIGPVDAELTEQGVEMIAAAQAQSQAPTQICRKLLPQNDVGKLSVFFAYGINFTSSCSLLIITFILACPTSLHQDLLMLFMRLFQQIDKPARPGAFRAAHE